MNQEFILYYLLPGLVVWLLSFRFPVFEKVAGIVGTFALFCVLWPVGVAVILFQLLVQVIKNLEPAAERLEKLLMTDIFKGKDND